MECILIITSELAEKHGFKTPEQFREFCQVAVQSALFIRQFAPEEEP